jgi:hypothetical protein
MNRRGFLGFFAGSAALGKSAVVELEKTILQEGLTAKNALKFLPLGKNAKEQDASPIKSSYIPENPFETIKRYKKQLEKLSRRPNSETLRDAADYRRKEEIVNLISVSKSHKHRMISDVDYDSSYRYNEFKYGRWIKNLVAGRDEYDDGED